MVTGGPSSLLKVRRFSQASEEGGPSSAGPRSGPQAAAAANSPPAEETKSPELPGRVRSWSGAGKEEDVEGEEDEGDGGR